MARTVNSNLSDEENAGDVTDEPNDSGYEMPEHDKEFADRADIDTAKSLDFDDSDDDCYHNGDNPDNENNEDDDLTNRR